MSPAEALLRQVVADLGSLAGEVVFTGGAIRAFHAVLFAAAKVEAFKSRGASDPWTSQDLEDFLTLIDCRPSIEKEIAGSEPDVRGCIAGFAAALIEDPDCDELLLCHMAASSPGWQGRNEELKATAVFRKAFYDTLDKAHLREFLQRRVRDGAVLRLIGKWTNAGVLEAGNTSYPEAGTPQGGVISPLLSNVYLHEVMDVWFEREVRPRLNGLVFLIRYADDIAIGFTREDDARRVLAVLPKRFGKYGPTLHPDKTRLIDFRRPKTPPDPPGPSGGPRPQTFDLLGFTHYWARSRNGHWVIKRKTARDRLTRAIKRVAEWCRAHRHWSIHDQHEALARKLQGHCGYYGITGNSPMLTRFRGELLRRWHQCLNRRSQRNDWSWERFLRYLERNPFPPATPVHSTYRLAAKP